MPRVTACRGNSKLNIARSNPICILRELDFRKNSWDVQGLGARILFERGVVALEDGQTLSLWRADLEYILNREQLGWGLQPFRPQHLCARVPPTLTHPPPSSPVPRLALSPYLFGSQPSRLAPSSGWFKLRAEPGRGHGTATETDKIGVEFKHFPKPGGTTAQVVRSRQAAPVPVPPHLEAIHLGHEYQLVRVLVPDELGRRIEGSRRRQLAARAALVNVGVPRGGAVCPHAAFRPTAVFHRSATLIESFCPWTRHPSNGNR